MTELTDIEINIVNYLGKNNHVDSKVTLGDDNILYTHSELMLKKELDIDNEDIKIALLNIEKRGYIVIYFDSAYIHLSHKGEELYKSYN